jgi:hypothetical protein
MSTTQSSSSPEPTLRDDLIQLIDAFDTARYIIRTRAAERSATAAMIRLPLALEVICDLFVALNHQIGLGRPDWESLATDRLGGSGGRGVKLLYQAQVALRLIYWDTRPGNIEDLLKQLDTQLVGACLVYLGYHAARPEDVDLTRDDIATLLVN